MDERTVHLLHGAFFAVTTEMTDFFSGNGAILLLDTKMEAEGAHEHLGSIRQGQIQRVLPGGRAAAGRGGRAGRGAWLQKSGYWPPAAGNAPDRPRPGGEVPGREKYLGAGRPASAGADREGPALHLDRKALAPDLKRAMDYALIGAQNAHLAKAEPEHLLCAMLEDTDCAAGVLLASMGVQLAEAVRECRQLSGQFILPLQPRALRPCRGAAAPVINTAVI